MKALFRPLTLRFAFALLAAVPSVRAADSGVPSLVEDACIYGYALNGMMQRMSGEVLDPATRKAGFNEFFHYTKLATPEVAPFRAPNNDTLYSIAWVDLREAPVILDVPDTKGRYYTAHVMNFYTDTIANLGARLHGTDAGAFALVGPESKGDLTLKIKDTVRCESNFALILLRVLVDGPNDVAAVNALQTQFRLRPVLPEGKAETAGPAALPLYTARTASERFAVLNSILRANPVRRGEEALMQRFASIGLGPEAKPDAKRPDEATLQAAEEVALKKIKAAGFKGAMVNGWRFVREGIGVYGADYLNRASVWDGGPLANVPAESLYPSGLMDSSGQMLDGGKKRYVIRLPEDRIPPVDFFWSFTMYQMSDGMLVKSPLDRYSIGNRTRGLKFAADGSLTLYVQPESPGAEREANWLPAPQAPFYLVLRLYGPQLPALNGTWQPPAIEPVK